jgi:FAD/FMN-containing dehydrogenase/Fe-S oxidoreductase
MTAPSTKSVRLPDPVVRPRTDTNFDVAALERDLQRAVDGEVRFDAGSRAAYSTDASNYRQVPIGVVVPYRVETVPNIVRVCREHDVPLLSRGGGTSLAGECTNVAVVIDWSKYCNRLLSVDAEHRTCIVEPGIVLDHLTAQLYDDDIEFGPAPATHDHCTLGGMIGNNSCGATAQRAGKVVDNIARLEVLLYDGTRMWVGETTDDDYERIIAAGGRRAELYAQLRTLRDEYADDIRRTYPDIPRRVSGYNIDSLLPDKHFHIAQLLVGSESTLVTVLRAELTLIPRVHNHTLVVVGFPDIASAGDAVPTILPAQPIALEAFDSRLIDQQREKHMNAATLKLLPEGDGYLMVQMGGETSEEADAAAAHRLSLLGRHRDDPDVSFFDDPQHEHNLWEIREAGLGATARIPGVADAWPGWEDSAVAPNDVGDYLRDLQKLFDEFDLEDVSRYGHFGQGCIHCRIPFELQTAAGIARFRAFLERAADLVVSYGGSLSGEHGDGQGRGELLKKMFGDRITLAFGQLKAIFDPGDRMNPGKVIPPAPLDANLRLGVDYDHHQIDTAFRYPDDDGDFGRAVLRCVGVGKCRREAGGVMCPSYMVTREEEHSTRGRARLLFEMLDGDARGGAIGDGWRSDAVKNALDLCLACKGCKTDCPVNVDMATYKAEFLHHHYARRLRPPSHYSMGWLPVLAAGAAHAPRAANALAHAPVIAALGKRLAGVDSRRSAPFFAPQTFQQWFRDRPPPGAGTRGDVLVWPDTFTNHFDPAIGRAAVEVIEAAGFHAVVPEQHLCCGLTWISTGQLDVAKYVLQQTMDVLRDHVRGGGLVLGLEPSCTAVFRSDAFELLPREPDVERLRRQTVTLAELLQNHCDWEPPHLDRTAHIQTHCHQHAIMGFDADRALMERMGLTVDVLDSGCCGLAGNFGFERGHYEVSEACAERVLLPAVRSARAHDVIVADGFSCRTQLAQSDAGGRRGVHLAEVIRAALDGDDDRPYPETRWAPRLGPHDEGPHQEGPHQEGDAMTSVHEGIDKAGDVATEVISSAVGAVADPKGAMSAATKKSRRIAPWAVLAIAMIGLLVFLNRRRR